MQLSNRRNNNSYVLIIICGLRSHCCWLDTWSWCFERTPYTPPHKYSCSCGFSKINWLPNLFYHFLWWKDVYFVYLLLLHDIFENLSLFSVSFRFFILFVKLRNFNGFLNLFFSILSLAIFGYLENIPHFPKN